MRGNLLLSDIGKNQRMKWSPGEGMSLVATDTQGANRMTRELVSIRMRVRGIPVPGRAVPTAPL